MKILIINQNGAGTKFPNGLHLYSSDTYAALKINLKIDKSLRKIVS